jgi:hypothetical protein
VLIINQRNYKAVKWQQLTRLPGESAEYFVQFQGRINNSTYLSNSALLFDKRMPAVGF